MRDIAIIDAVRTPQGALGGTLKPLTAQQLGEHVVRALLERTRIAPSAIEEVIFGCVGQGSDAPNIARVLALQAGIPIETPAYTVARNCASGMQALVSAAQNILSGDRDIQIAGGTESMSRAPYVNRDLRFGKHLRHSSLIDSLWEGLTDPVCHMLMGETAEALVTELGINRQEQDRFAVLSHQRAFRATREGKFKDELVTISVPKSLYGKPLPPDVINQDEGPNPALNEQLLAGYPPIFKTDGSVTAGNSCPISDGAAGVLLMSGERAKALGYTPLGYIRAYAFAGVEPRVMGLGPTAATPLALQRAGMTVNDVQLVELNEAFAAQVLACERVLKLNREIMNVNGGAIAIGHPVGASGARIIVTLLHEMRRRNLSTGLATLCVGGGQGGAMILERK